MATELTWDEIAGRLHAASIWWVSTAHRTRGPHAVPVWGVVEQGTAYTFGTPGSRRHRDLADEPRAVVHLESGSDVLIVRGTFGAVGAPASHPAVCAAFAAKYDEVDYLPDAPGSAGSVLMQWAPRSALAWTVSGGYVQRRWPAS